jgi:hypothetical protein
MMEVGLLTNKESSPQVVRVSCMLVVTSNLGLVRDTVIIQIGLLSGC